MAEPVEMGVATAPPDAEGRALVQRGFDAWSTEVHRLATERNAVVLAHNYQVPWIQDVADFVGDSLALSRTAADTGAETIVFCGVHFMAETAKILSPGKTVLLPDLGAGCSLSDTITADQLRAWKAEHPGAVVVAYVNTTAAVKAESDICCTSSNAADVVNSIPAGKTILFLPDMFLGAHVERETGRDMEIWMGECHVHAGIDPSGLRDKVAADPDTELLVHPECGCTTQVLWQLSEGDLPADRTKVLSTGGMVAEARTSDAGRFLIATETGILHQLRKGNPDKAFEPVDETAVCKYMKTITPERLYVALRDGVFEIDVPEDIARRARRAVERMIELGPGAPSAGTISNGASGAAAP
ncbi:MAG: quinolinate synthase NadA [Actinomycetota bacterium]